MTNEKHKRLETLATRWYGGEVLPREELYEFINGLYQIARPILNGQTVADEFRHEAKRVIAEELRLRELSKQDSKFLDSWEAVSHIANSLRPILEKTEGK